MNIASDWTKDRGNPAVEETTYSLNGKSPSPEKKAFRNYKAAGLRRSHSEGLDYRKFENVLSSSWLKKEKKLARAGARGRAVASTEK